MVSHSKPFSETIPLIEIRYGSTVVRATTVATPILWQGNIYRPEPAIDVTLPKQGGGLAEEACKITLPRLRGQVNSEVAAVAEMFATPRATPKTYVKVMSLDRSGDQQTLTYLYSGIVSMGRRNPNRRAGIVEIEVQTEMRAGLKDTSLGRRADPECDFVFGSVGCYVDNTRFFAAGDSYYPQQYKKVRRAWVRVQFFNPATSPREATLSLDSVQHSGADPRTLTFQPRDWWLRSYLERDGLRIQVQEWRWNTVAGAGTDIFILQRIPPTSWSNAVCQLVLDCPRTAAACLARQGDHERFGGLGYGIPAYNPTLEQR